MFKDRISNSKKPFELSKIVFNTGETQEIGKKELNKINILTSEVLKGTKDINEISLKDAVLSKENKIDGIDFESLASDFDFEEQQDNTSKYRFKNKKNIPFGNKGSKQSRNVRNTSNSDIQQSRYFEIDGGVDINIDDEDVDF